VSLYTCYVLVKKWRCVCVYYVFSVHCHVGWLLFDMESSPRGPLKAGSKKIPPGVFRVMWCVSYCVESKLYFFCAFLTFHVFLWFYLFYTIVCCCNMGRWVVLVLLKFIFNHLYTYAFNSSSANISRCLCECRLYKTCAEIVCVKK